MSLEDGQPIGYVILAHPRDCGCFPGQFTVVPVLAIQETEIDGELHRGYWPSYVAGVRAVCDHLDDARRRIPPTAPDRVPRLDHDADLVVEFWL